MICKCIIYTEFIFSLKYLNSCSSNHFNLDFKYNRALIKKPTKALAK